MLSYSGLKKLVTAANPEAGPVRNEVGHTKLWRGVMYSLRPGCVLAQKSTYSAMHCITQSSELLREGTLLFPVQVSKQAHRRVKELARSHS